VWRTICGVRVSILCTIETTILQKNMINWCNLQGFHGCDCSECGLLGCNTI
jgi:hypothetical protein